jgi:hypothetical protein
MYLRVMVQFIYCALTFTHMTHSLYILNAISMRYIKRENKDKEGEEIEEIK